MIIGIFIFFFVMVVTVSMRMMMLGSFNYINKFMLMMTMRQSLMQHEHTEYAQKEKG